MMGMEVIGDMKKGKKIIYPPFPYPRPLPPTAFLPLYLSNPKGIMTRVAEPVICDAVLMKVLHTSPVFFLPSSSTSTLYSPLFPISILVSPPLSLPPSLSLYLLHLPFTHLLFPFTLPSLLSPPLPLPRLSSSPPPPRHLLFPFPCLFLPCSLSPTRSPLLILLHTMAC